MFIALNGQLGSGKSAICDVLKRHGFEAFSTGTIQRAFAKELGISTLELNERGKEDFSYDYEIDRRLSEYAKANVGKDIVFDSRMAWHFVPGAYKVHLLVSPATAAKRVYENRTSDVEKFASLKDAEKELIDRRRSEIERYELIYKVDMSDLRNYDLVLDTSTLTIEEVGETVYEHAKAGKSAVLVSPQNVYPTSDDVDTALVDEYAKRLERGEDIQGIELISSRDKMYVYSGHEAVAAYNRLRRGICPAKVICRGRETVPGTIICADEYVSSKKADLEKWETLNGFEYPVSL